MKEVQALYLKEMKEYRAVFIFMLVGTALAAIVSVFSIGEGGLTATTTAEIRIGEKTLTTDYDWSAHVLWGVAPYFLVFVLPLLLLHSFAQEVKGQTQYLLLSLPVSRSTIFLCKIASLATIAAAVYVITTAAVSVVYVRAMDMADHFTGMSVTKIGVGDLWLLVGNGYFSILVLCLGIASGIAGLRLVIRRMQGLSAAAFTCLALYVYARWFEEASNLLAWVFGTHQITTFGDQGQTSLLSSGLNEAVYSIAFGSALIALGVWLYERRVEV